MKNRKKALKTIHLTAVASSFVLSSGSLCGCAGPVTPIGAIWDLTPERARKITGLEAFARALEQLSSPRKAPKLSITPGRQVLHGRTSLRIKIQDPSGGELDDYDLFVRYNGLDVTRGFLQQASISFEPSERTVTIEAPLIRLPADRDHHIEFIYKNSAGDVASAQYEPPICSAHGSRRVIKLGTFSPPRRMVSSIDRLSKEASLNPAYFTALIAQESSFNPRTVSWAKALGLTQVTSAAESEVVKKLPEWPRYPGLAEMPVAMIKWLILTGDLNASNEWRLDEDRSIEGGILYTKILLDRWSTPENEARIREIFPEDGEIAKTRLILASYHSGYARVIGALESRGAKWLQSPDLKEAKNYVNRVFSFCSYFSDEETEHARTS